MTVGGMVNHWTLLGSAKLCKCHKKRNGYVSEVAKLDILCRNSSSNSSLISAQLCVQLHLDVNREHAQARPRGGMKSLLFHVSCAHTSAGHRG